LFGDVVAGTSITESSLLKKWVLAGIQAQKLEIAVRQYMERKTDLRGGAALAGVAYNRFLQELEARNVVVLEDDRFLERLAGLAELFTDEVLQDAVNRTYSLENPMGEPRHDE
jgi:hypothetical protein